MINLLPSKREIAEALGKPTYNISIGFYSTIGDLLHPGHLVCLREAKNYCDYLIVGLINDPTADRPESKNKPVQSLLERYIQLASCKYVDCVIPLSGEQDLEDALLLLLPDVRFAGAEYKDRDHTGKDISNIKMIYLERKHSFSSTDLRSRVYEAEKPKQIINTDYDYFIMDVKLHILDIARDYLTYNENYDRIKFLGEVADLLTVLQIEGKINSHNFVLHENTIKINVNDKELVSFTGIEDWKGIIQKDED